MSTINNIAWYIMFLWYHTLTLVLVVREMFIDSFSVSGIEVLDELGSLGSNVIFQFGVSGLMV